MHMKAVSAGLGSHQLDVIPGHSIGEMLEVIVH